MKLIKGLENDFYRIYRDSKGIYHRFEGKKEVLKFKAKRWDRPIGMSVGHKPTSNFKIIK